MSYQRCPVNLGYVLKQENPFSFPDFSVICCRQNLEDTPEGHWELTSCITNNIHTFKACLDLLIMMNYYKHFFFCIGLYVRESTSAITLGTQILHFPLMYVVLGKNSPGLHCAHKFGVFDFTNCCHNPSGNPTCLTCRTIYV